MLIQSRLAQNPWRTRTPPHHPQFAIITGHALNPIMQTHPTPTAPLPSNLAPTLDKKIKPRRYDSPLITSTYFATATSTPQLRLPCLCALCLHTPCVCPQPPLPAVRHLKLRAPGWLALPPRPSDGCSLSCTEAPALCPLAPRHARTHPRTPPHTHYSP